MYKEPQEKIRRPYTARVRATCCIEASWKMTIDISIPIIPEYAKLVPPLSSGEYQELKQSIKENGLWHPIIVNKEGTVLDGHHRFKACQELCIEPTTAFKNFATPLQEKQFVINSNLKRRHLNDFQKAELGYTLEGLYREDAKRLSLKLGTVVPSVSNDNNGEKARTSAIISKQVGISASIYNRAKKLILEGSESTKQNKNYDPENPQFQGNTKTSKLKR